MRFLIDECTGPAVAKLLMANGHEVFSVFHECRGASDEEILLKANSENWIIIINDKDFGEKVYREKYSHKGVIFLRLGDERSQTKIRIIERLLAVYSAELVCAFVVVTEKQVRFARSI